MSFDRPRKITDPKAMRAMAHPIRLALLEALTDAGTLTATEAGELVGESPANASFHLRQLAKYGFVEEAEGGTGRKRPWKLVHLGMSFTDVHDDPETATAARGLDRVLRDRYLARAAPGVRGPPGAARGVARGDRHEPDGPVPDAGRAEGDRRGDHRAPVQALRRPPRAEPGPCPRAPSASRSSRSRTAYEPRHPHLPHRAVAQPARRHRAVARARPVGEGPDGLELAPPAW